MSTGSLGALLDSRSLAVVGASSRAGSSGKRVIDHLAASGYDGDVVLVSRREEQIGGRRTYPSLAAYPGPVDHALLLVPAAALTDTLDECAAKGVAVASIFASGFAELSAEGEREQERLRAAAAAGGVRLLGPNCLGVINAHTGLVATASAGLESIALAPGKVSVVSQSGAVGMHFVALLEQAGLGLRYYVSTGNEVDITAGEVLDHLARDEETDVVLLYLEGVRDPGRFCAALQRLRESGKQVIAIKVGRTARSSAAVASHTASLAGNDAVYDAVLRRLGAARVESPAQAVTAASMIRSGVVRRPGPERVAVVSISGGLGALMAEELDRRGLELPVPAPATQAAMREIVPFCTPTNPIDLTGQITATPERLEDFLKATVADGSADTVALLLSYTVLVPRVFDVFRRVLLAVAAETDVALIADGLFSDEQRRELARYGVPTTRDTRELAEAIDLLRALHRLDASGTPFEPGPPGPGSGTALPDVVAMERMDRAGVPMAPWLVVADAAEAAGVADRLGGSIALKLLVPGVLHKASAGLVETGVSAAEAPLVARRLLDRGAPGAQLVAQAMGPADSAEVIVGARRDEVFGLVLLVGRGGLDAEATADTAVLLPPLRRADLGDALARLRTPLRTPSGSDVDEDALWEVLRALATLVADDEDVVDAELNPVLVGPQGAGAVAVDAVIRCGRPHDAGPSCVPVQSTGGQA